MEVIILTEAAQKQVASLKPKVKDGLRVQVIGGGCSGLQYKIGFDDAREDDMIHEYEDGLAVIVDPKSAILLQGATLDYFNQIDRNGFEISNPNATNSCGCGKSFGA